MRASPESPRMFESDALDVLTRTPWWTVPLVFVPVVVGLFGYGVAARGVAIPAALGLAAAGWFAWTLTEYWLHRTVFHWEPDHAWGRRLHFFVHGVHHDWPNDKYRLVLPPAVSIVLSALFFGLFLALLGSVRVGPFFAGYLFGYLIYDCSHYAIHHFKWKGRVFTRLKANHMNHHFKDPTQRFGVSMTVWDYVFGTR